MCLLVLWRSLAAACPCHAQSQWVHFGTNGALVYFSDDLTNHLIDYSYAGYEGGGVAIPTNMTVQQTVNPVSGDNTTNIQNGIDAVSALAPDANGFRGVVLLNPGSYEMDGIITISTSGVILRGSGTSTVLSFNGTPGTSITISGSSGTQQSGSTTYTITDNYVPLGATNLHLNTTSGLSAGMGIVVRRPWTQTWINAIGMSNLWTATGHQNDAERTITAINGTQVTVDIPLPTPVEQKWVTGVVFPYTDSGKVQQCAVESLSMVSLEGGGTGTSYPFGATGVQLGNCKNCWVKNVAFSGYGVAVNGAPGGGSKWCTAQDCTYSNGVNNGSARPSAFQIGGQMCLFQRLTGISGFEHFLQTDDEATGPNAFLYCNATGSDFDGGPHRYWAVSLLTDNEYGDIGNVHVVIITGGDNGWGAGYSVFYNCHVNNFTIQEPPVDHTYNWWVGGSGANTNPTNDAGIYDAAGTTVAPTSLYLEQLKERLGGAAVENIGYQLFTISTAPASQTVALGSNATYTVTLGDPVNMSNAVALSVSGLPSGSSAAFNTNSVTGEGQATLTISTSNLTPIGSYLLNVIGTSAGLAHTSAVTLVVGNPSFFLSASPASQTVTAGGSTNYAVTVLTNSNFGGSVIFGLSGLPPGASASFSPPSVSNSASSTLGVTTTTNTPPGTYALTVSGDGATLTNTWPLVLIVNSIVVSSPGTFLWSATNNSSATTNWSTPANWSPPGPPGPLGDAKFFDPGAAATVSNINNVVDSSFTINSLQYGNSNGFHTTLITPGRTLTVGGLTVGTETDNGNTQAVYATITGLGGMLALNNVNSNLVVRQGVATASGNSLLRATFDLSGLDTFTAAVAKIEIGSLGTNARPSGTLYLAKTNLITASGAAPAIQIGGQGGGSGNAGNGSFLYLGQTNAIFANGISVATVKQGGCSMLFNPALSNGNPVAYFRGADGVSPVPTWYIADSQSQGGTVNTTGTNDFTGGTINALVDELTLARSSTGSGNGNPAGTLTFAAGTIAAGTIEIGLQGSSGTNFSTGIVNVNGSAILMVTTNLELAVVSGGVGASNTTGALNLNGGSVRATNILGGGGVSVINLNRGTLDLQAGNPAPGRIANVSALNVGFPGASSVALLTNAASVLVSNAITIASNGVIAGNTFITAPALIINGTISPGGGGVGAITNGGSATLGAGGSYAVGVQDTHAGPGEGWDFFQNAGLLNMQAASTNPFTIKLLSLASNQVGAVSNFTYGTNYDWVIATAGGGITNFSSNSFAVDDSLFQNDLAGGYFYIRTNSASLILSFANNLPPVAATVTLYRSGHTMTIPIASLAAGWSDPDGDPVTLFLVNANSANGLNNVGTDGINIYYTSGTTLPDTITYLVADVRTNPPAVYRPEDTVQTAVGQIIILPPPAISGVTLSGSRVVLSGMGGIHAGPYYVLATTNVALPLNQWVRLGTNAFDGAGNLQFTNGVNAGATQEFYRLQFP
jgi:hypothetical protein